MKRWIAAIALAAASPAAAAPGGPYQAFAAYLENYRKEKRIPALAALIVRDGRVAWEAAYGWSDDEGEVPATPDTVFWVASLTKPIAATAILKEAAEGRLSLDLPMTRDPGWAETCAWLSGSDIPFGGGGREADGTPVPKLDCSPHKLADVLDMRVNEGDGFVYNPIVFARLDRAILGGGGRPLGEMVRANVLAPAGMVDTALGWRDAEAGAAHRLLAPPFQVGAAGPEKRPLPDDDFRAAAGIYTSVRQLARFDIAFDRGALLPPVWQARVTDAWRARPGYAFGWFNQAWKGRRLMWHSGWEPNSYSAIYLKVPDEKLTLIVLANSEALWWGNSLVRAEIEKSPVAERFLSLFTSPER